MSNFTRAILLIYSPSQVFIFVIIAAQFSLYIFIRQVVNTKEWLSACESNSCIPTVLSYVASGRGRKGELRRRLRASRTYDVSTVDSNLRS